MINSNDYRVLINHYEAVYGERQRNLAFLREKLEFSPQDAGYICIRIEQLEEQSNLALEKITYLEERREEALDQEMPPL